MTPIFMPGPRNNRGCCDWPTGISHWHQLDAVNLVEEIESLGRQPRQALRSRLGVLLGHLLKWEFQPEHRAKSWFVTLREQRREIADLLEESPSLKPYLEAAIAKGYEAGLDLDVRETAFNYRDFPTNWAYTMEQILSFEFLPGKPLEEDRF